MRDFFDLEVFFIFLAKLATPQRNLCLKIGTLTQRHRPLRTPGHKYPL